MAMSVCSLSCSQLTRVALAFIGMQVTVTLAAISSCRLEAAAGQTSALDNPLNFFRVATPCIRHRFLPRTGAAWHGAPPRVRAFAPQRAGDRRVAQWPASAPKIPHQSIVCDQGAEYVAAEGPPLFALPTLMAVHRPALLTGRGSWPG
jgi:hypothetical protein